jgi:hypothetical protein
MTSSVSRKRSPTELTAQRCAGVRNARFASTRFVPSLGFVEAKRSPQRSFDRARLLVVEFRVLLARHKEAR